MNRCTTALIALCLCVSSLSAGDSLKIMQLEKRITVLEERLAVLEGKTAPVLKQLSAQEMKEDQRNKARERMRKDLEVYSREELREIESLYQVANKNWKSDKAKGKASLEKMLDKYDRANRTGCALMYLGQMTQGEEREKYLKKAVESYSDCYYGDGVQVGAYARYYLAYHYLQTGNKKKAGSLCAEIRADYPNAVTHSGQPLSGGLDKLEKELQ